jgi:predicted nucleic acid-binding protein
VRRALRKFEKLPERVSFTDCVVMAVADYYQTQDISGFDQQFAQAGYQILSSEAQAA